MSEVDDEVNSLEGDAGLDKMIEQLSTNISDTVEGFMLKHVKEGTLEEDYVLRYNPLSLIDKEYVRQEQLTMTYKGEDVATARLLVYLEDADDALDVVVELLVPSEDAENV